MNQQETIAARPYFRELEAKEREACVNAIPKVRLAEKHMRHCELLLNRAELLARLPRQAITAELGVDHAAFSEEILKVAQPKTLHLVDLWNSDRYHDGLFEGTKAKFANEIAAGRVRIHRQYSVQAAADFEDDYFDWIYVDTDHSYETTARELRSYAAKIKQDGIIAGHDYSMGNWVSSYRYGVIEALHEFCAEQNWEFVYLTMDPFESQSFAIRRIPSSIGRLREPMSAAFDTRADAATQQQLAELSTQVTRRDAVIEALQGSLAQAAKSLHGGGSLLQEMSGVAQALEDITRELARLPLTAPQTLAFADICIATKNLQEAGVLLESALRLDPGNATIRNRLSTLRGNAPPVAASNLVAQGVLCPCCKGQFELFRPFGTPPRANAMCPNCGSLERHRLMQLYFERKTNLFSAPLKVLHFAPEACFAAVLDNNPLIDYISADLYAPNAKQKIDITDIPYADDSFDVILCSHVLEHIPDDHRAMRELRRVLKPQGWALLQVPIDHRRATTFEDPSVTDPAERLRLFGQHDHVRWYGRDYATRLVRAGFDVRVDDFFGELADDLVRHYGLIAGEDIHFCTKSTRP
ncbi:hypothetical protein BH11PSE8_BH11PSE8_30760 [soil metagenome]